MDAIFQSISDGRRKIEITAVFLTGAGKFIFMDWLEWKLLFILTAIFGWTAYVLVRRKQMPAILRYWGFRTDNFKQLLRMVLPFGVISVLAFFLMLVVLTGFSFRRRTFGN